MPNKVALNAVMATLAAAMRHSPAFDIVGIEGTSMIGKSQGETEIPLDLAEGVLPTGNAFA